MHWKALKRKGRALWGAGAAFILVIAGGAALWVSVDPGPDAGPAALGAAQPAPRALPAATAPERASPPVTGPLGASAASSQAPPAPRWVKALPVVVVDAPAATLYSRLAAVEVSLEQAGDVARLHQALERCWMASWYERMAQWASTAAGPEEQAQAQRLADAQREDARPLCAGLASDAYARADEWTARLAAQGDPRSMMDYGKSYWIRDLESVMRDPERLAAFRRTTLAYLGALIDQGYADALIAMASLRSNPTWGEPQPAEVWAYLYAHAKASGNVPSQANLLQSIDQRVPPQGRQRAMERAQELLGRCCGG